MSFGTVSRFTRTSCALYWVAFSLFCDCNARGSWIGTVGVGDGEDLDAATRFDWEGLHWVEKEVEIVVHEEEGGDYKENDHNRKHLLN